MPWLIALRVVSLPATTSRMKNEPNSCGREPLAVDLGVHHHRGDVVARVGAAVLAERLGVHEHRRAHAAIRSSSVPPYSGSPTPRMMFVQSKICASSSAGMPIISQMICSGSGGGDLLDEVALAVGELLEQAVDDLGRLDAHVVLDLADLLRA